VEGIEVLYGTNTMHIRLSDFILSQRLAAIKSVELVFHLEFWNVTEPKYYGLDLEGYRSFIASLPEALPNLRLIYLCPQGWIYRDHVRLNIQQLDTAEILLAPIDSMARKLASLVDCRVALPVTFVKMLEWRARGGGPLPSAYWWNSSTEHFSWAKPVWRDLPAADQSAGSMAAEPAIKGYWICPGDRDEPRPPVMCF
jgi:hypothetical protein